jgi:hypothetical protein
MELLLLKLVDESALSGLKLLNQYFLKSAWKEAILSGEKNSCHTSVTLLVHKACNSVIQKGDFCGKMRVPVYQCHRCTVTPVRPRDRGAMNTRLGPFCGCGSAFPEACREEHLTGVVTIYTVLIRLLLEGSFSQQGRNLLLYKLYTTVTQLLRNRKKVGVTLQQRNGATVIHCEILCNKKFCDVYRVESEAEILSARANKPRSRYQKIGRRNNKSVMNKQILTEYCILQKATSK